MRTQLIKDYLNGLTLSQIGKDNNLSEASVSYYIISTIKKLKQLKLVRSHSDLYQAIRHDKSARDINNNRRHWQKVIDLVNPPVVQYHKPVTTIFKGKNIDDAFDIARLQDANLSAYDGALLMYNTIVSEHKIKK